MAKYMAIAGKEILISHLLARQEVRGCGNKPKVIFQQKAIFVVGDPSLMVDIDSIS